MTYHIDDPDFRPQSLDLKSILKVMNDVVGCEETHILPLIVIVGFSDAYIRVDNLAGASEMM